jgi:hypothetical protein
MIHEIARAYDDLAEIAPFLVLLIALVRRRQRRRHA